MREDYLGTDVLFDEDGDLAVGPTGDLVSVSGRDCLLQDIRDRLGTLPGDLFAHSDWGCGIGRLLGALDTPLNRALAIRNIRQALEADPSVRDDTIRITPITFTSEVKNFEIHFMPEGSKTPEMLIWGFGITELPLQRIS